MVEWAEANGCSDLVEGISEEHFYIVTKETTYEVGPMGGPCYRDWDYSSKERPPDDVLRDGLLALVSLWQEHPDPVWQHTLPIEFTGEKARRLCVAADPHYSPPWGTWASRAASDLVRIEFTRFRERVNSILNGHEVDHIDFDTSRWSK